MLFSIYTPTNNPSFLRSAYKSIQKQTYKNWEWVVVPNSGSLDMNSFIEEIRLITNNDDKVKIYPQNNVTNNIGALKQYACSFAIGDVFLELDHDDLLVDNCLELIRAIAKPEHAQFFYSDWIEFRDDGSSSIYDVSFGWINYPVTIEDKFYRATKAFEPSARAIAEIYFAPNHVRAWTRKAFQSTGGYNVGMIVGDDHDLVCRTYLSGTEFVYIDKPIYMYRVHQSNTVKLFNSQIQIQQVENRNKYLHKLIDEECRRKSLKKLNMGRFVDMESAHITIETLKKVKWKIDQPDNSLGYIKAYDFLQLVPSNKVKQLIEEIYRVLIPGGWFLTSVPSTDGRGAFQDIRHKSYWNDNSWWYWTKKDCNVFYYPKQDNKTPKFQSVRRWTAFSSNWHKQHNIPYCFADLCALKDQRQPGNKEGWS